jgi:FkbM family methyltransferase
MNYDKLLRNIEYNKFDNITTINAFVSSKTQKIRFYHNTKKPGSSFGKGYKSNDSSDLVEFDVNTIKIDDVINNLKNIVIKIDVEGAEYEILEGLANSKNISQVLEITTEVSTQNQNQFDSLNMILSKYRYLGFEPRLISNYDIMSLSDKLKQGHLQLILVRV